MPPSDSRMPPQMPELLPGEMVQGRPLQQSAVVVQTPLAFWQAEPPQMKPVPAPFGRQGSPQQSAELAHALPASEPASVAVQSRVCVPRQRGMPRLSCWQISGYCWSDRPPGLPFGFVPQQTSLVLHEVPESLHTLPGGEHTFPFAHRPGVVAVLPAHTTCVVEPYGRPTAPQQSVSLSQISPVGWQPDAG